MCPFHNVKQYHVESDNQIGVTFILGTFQPEETKYDTELHTVEHIYRDKEGGRQVFLSIVCSPNNKHYLQDMKEDPEHVYR